MKEIDIEGGRILDLPVFVVDVVVAVVVGVVVTLSCWLTEQAWTSKNACVRAYKTWLTPIRSNMVNSILNS